MVDLPSLDDPSMLAGEYVLGTLDAAERRAFSRRLLMEPAQVALVADWQERLAPLLISAPEVAPPDHLWTRIENATRTGVAANDNQRVGRWQIATAAAALLALVTTGLALRPIIPPTRSPTVAHAPQPGLVQQIAALSSEGGTPALLVSYDVATHKMRVLPVNVTPTPGHSMELWVIAGKAAPRSIGLMPKQGMALLDHLHVDPALDTTIAVSLEPVGGSPTGAPTGPVVYSGRMMTLSKS
jgi:anti-sigma-K factor RskA